jgi:hypothetical protein
MSGERFHEYLVRRISPDESYKDLLDFPRFFEIETVNACNARCPMCTIGDWTRHAPVMKDALFSRIADELGEHAATVRRVSLYRDGEPLLDKKLPERIALLKAKSIREVAISTNVSLLDQRRGRAILEAGIDMVILSIDSLRKEIFEAIRAGLTFEQVRDNALAFIALRDRVNPATRITVRMIRQHGNQDEWPAYEAFWKPHMAAGDRLYFNNIHNWGDQLKGFAAIADSLEPKLPCVALWSLMPIFADGKVPLCNADFANRHPAGDLSTHSIAEIWRSHLANSRRRLHLDGRKAEIDLCAQCNIWDEPPDKVAIAGEFLVAEGET